MKSIILFGDSVFFGIGASSRDKGCGKLLKKSINAPVIIKSRNLDTSRDGLARLKKDVLEKEDASFIIIMFGNNDCRLDKKNLPIVSLQEYKYNLKTMVNEIKSACTIPLISNLQPISSVGFFNLFPAMKNLTNIYGQPNLWQKKYSDICSELCYEENTHLVNIRFSLERDIDNILANDGLHPNDYGHKLIAQELARAIKAQESIVKCF